ncbi:HAD family hydrolase [Microvirga pakistanensis]|uniref:HAD family hydrolase n=1 Tax=Microvirga pakistanensis TaxID=1682650 RepID=UPI00106D880D|nr:HAD family phosphatase [Microvirga pakistanensis]
MTEIKAVAWDIDGTLIDSEPLHLVCLIAVSARYGVDLSQDPGDRFLGRDMHWVWDTLRPRFPAALTFETWLAEILDAYVESASTLVPRPFVIEAMHRLHQAGIRQVCVSNSERRVVDANLAALGVAQLLEFSISRDDVPVGKPDPTPYREACLRLGLKPTAVMAVEDSQSGLMSAMAAGLQVTFIADHENNLDTRRKAVDTLLAGCSIESAKIATG